ncbi:MAG: hypothetical protein C0417_10570 [Chlorobiaceae bacterium]|nr:hypothetical protein [Chlorobiaceae bacterium]
MKSLVIFFILFLSLSVNLYSQLTHLGLDSITVNDVRYHDNSLYVGTIDSGVYRFDTFDSTWTCLGLKHKWITTIYPYPFDTGRYSITVGIRPNIAMEESTAISSMSGYGWIPDDSGITHSHSEFDGILSIDASSFNGDTNFLFATGRLGIYKRSDIFWEKISYDGGNPFGGIYLLEISPFGTIWIAGQGFGWMPIIGKSTDRGNTWAIIPIDLGFFYIYSFSFDSKNSDMLYGAGGSNILKTTDSGNTWQKLMDNPNIFIRAITIDPFDDNHLFAGGDHLQLYETTNAGDSWQLITAVDSGNHITDIEIPATEISKLYISTYKNGVYQLPLPHARFRIKNERQLGWNLVSIPVRSSDSLSFSVFPPLPTPAFAYEGQYVIEDTLRTGVGYWVKYSKQTTEYYIGEENLLDTIEIRAGWNMIGALSHPISVADIGASAGLTVGSFYTYTGVWYPSTSLNPGLAYWVKANQAGKLFLSVSPSKLTGQPIQIIPDGELPPSPPGAEIAQSTGQIPKRFSLEQNYPNPFNPTTDVRYGICDMDHVSLKVFDVLGREVATLVNEIKQPGEYTVHWNAEDIPSGIYFYRLQTDKYNNMKKMLLLR